MSSKKKKWQILKEEEELSQHKQSWAIVQQIIKRKTNKMRTKNAEKRPKHQIISSLSNSPRCINIEILTEEEHFYKYACMDNCSIFM